MRKAVSSVPASTMVPTDEEPRRPPGSQASQPRGGVNGSGANRPSRAAAKSRDASQTLDSEPGSESESDEDDTEKTELYCVCRTGDVGGTMLACDYCKDWFHVSIGDP